MIRTLTTGLLLASATLLGACAHQSGSSDRADSKSYQPRDEDRLANAEEEQQCRDMSPSGNNSSSRSMAITDCDIQAVDQAMARQSRELDLQDTDRGAGALLDSSVQRLPTSRRLGL